jgi:hypothetical protein
MSFRAGPVNDQFTYTTAEPASVAVQPGRLRVFGSHTILRQRLQFAAGKGPAGGAFTARWIRNGTVLSTITVADAAVEGSIAPPTVPTLADGDLLTFEVLGVSAATGAVVGILDVTTP